MALILNIETSTSACSVALGRDGKRLAKREDLSLNFSHSVQLHPFIQQVMQESGLEMKDLDAIAISMGPGSYTGLRIGTGAAKGLCLALNIPLIAVNTLQLIAAAAQRKNNSYAGHFVPMIDARRMEVYTQAFDADLKPINEVKPLVLTDEFFASLKGEYLFCGDGSVKCAEEIKNYPLLKIESDIYPLADEMIPFSEDAFAEKRFEDMAYFEPFYLKEYQSSSSFH